MTPGEIRQQLECIRQGGEERDDALYNIASSCAPKAITAMLEVLDELNTELTEIEAYTVVYALLEDLQITLPVIFDYLERSPLSTMGADCAYILGDIAGLGRREPDPRIVPALVKAGEIALGEDGITGLETHRSPLLFMVIHALRQCLYYGTAFAAQPFLISLLLQSVEIKEDLNGFDFFQLLEILYTNDKDYLLPKLNEILSSISSECELAETINEFIECKRTGDEYW